jgi:hypothetical protein
MSTLSVKTRWLVLFFLTPAIALGSLYSFPNNKRPAVPLKDACLIADAMLRSQGDDGRYFITEVTLCGDKQQSGWGAWNLWHYDKHGNQVNAYIPFPTGKSSLSYYPRGKRIKGREREVEFERDGMKIRLLR